ncbi:MAG: C25 family cysteine peptidase [Anaerolineae bacterium]
MHLIVSSKDKLQAKYGPGGLAQLEAKLQEYRAVLRNKNLDSALVYVDDPASLSPFNPSGLSGSAEPSGRASGRGLTEAPSGQSLAPVDAEDPTAIKGLLDALENALIASGQTLDSVLILGGDEIIPFHRLPNPSYSPGWDPDEEVPSDNPYASTDDEYLIPERAVGRMPDGRSNDIGLLLAQLDAAITHHTQSALSFFNFGYSAQVWRKASQAVYDTVGKLIFLRLSPPETAESFRAWWLRRRRFLYFNLHGSKDTPYWYGQRGSSYPVAFSPQLVASGDVKGVVAFSEACYGANIIGKDPDEAISLKLMQQGAACFVGSTKIAFGPSEPPSSEADLIGVYFLRHVKNRMPFGQAFKEAKIAFAKEMYDRQGGLDDDDEKTLLEFVLYGDPTLRR